MSIEEVRGENVADIAQDLAIKYNVTIEEIVDLVARQILDIVVRLESVELYEKNKKLLK